MKYSYRSYASKSPRRPSMRAYGNSTSYGSMSAKDMSRRYASVLKILVMIINMQM